MGDFKINEKTVFTQSGSAEPAMGSTVTNIPSAGLTGTIPSGVSLASATFPAGHVLQVVSHNSTTQTSTTLGSSADIVVADMTKAITPKGANSDFLVAVRWFGEVSQVWEIVFNIHKDGDGTSRSNRVNCPATRAYGLAMATLTHKDDDSSTPEICFFETLVKGSSSVIGTPITFKLVSDSNSARTLYTNRSGGSATATGSYEQGTSELIITEIAG